MLVGSSSDKLSDWNGHPVGGVVIRREYVLDLLNRDLFNRQHLDIIWET